jgi:hypothetical protein
MRPIHVATTLAAVTAGLSVAVSLHRRTGARVRATSPAAAIPRLTVDPEGVVLPFLRPDGNAPAGEAPAGEAPAGERPAPPARCGDSGGLTKAGSPCGARATTGGRCHHHPVAA